MNPDKLTSKAIVEKLVAMQESEGWQVFKYFIEEKIKLMKMRLDEDVLEYVDFKSDYKSLRLLEWLMESPARIIEEESINLENDPD